MYVVSGKTGYFVYQFEKIMKTLTGLVMIVLIASISASAQTKQNYQAVVDSAIFNAKRYAVNVKKVNWDTVRAQMYQSIAYAQSVKDLKPAFEILIATLRDNQAKLSNGNEVIAQYPDYKDAEIHNVVNTPEQTLTSKILDHDVRYIRIPSFDAKADLVKEASAMRSIIDTLSKENASSWIVDLRGCNGTNFRLLMAGLGPLLGEGLIASEIDRNEKIHKMFEIHNGRLYEDQHLAAHFATPVDLSQSKIAVLIDETTAGAGEIIALALKGRKQTQIFGWQSAGNVRITKQINVGQGLVLTLSSGYYQDRRGSIYKDNIFPQRKSDKSLSEKGLMHEATSWLRQSDAMQTASIVAKSDNVAVRP